MAVGDLDGLCLPGKDSCPPGGSNRVNVASVVRVSLYSSCSTSHCPLLMSFPFSLFTTHKRDWRDEGCGGAA